MASRNDDEKLRRQSMEDIEECHRQELFKSRLLHAISNELIGEQNIDSLYGKIIDAAARLMDSQFASMQMLATGHDGMPELRLLGHRGFIPEAAEHWARVRMDSATICGAAFAAGRRVIVPDIEHCPFMAGTEDLAIYRKTGIRAVQSTPLHSRAGKLLGMISTCWDKPHAPPEHDLQLLDILARQAADLIERTTMEEMLRESEGRFRALADASPGLIWQIDLHGNTVYVNQRYLEIIGQTPEQLLVKGWHSILHPDDAPGYLTAVNRALRERTLLQARSRVKISGGTYRWFESHAAPWLSVNGEYRGHVGLMIDITDAVQAEGALKEADRRKDEFLATLAHELRNPLAPISNGVQLLQRSGRPAEQERVVNMVARQVSQVVKLVDDLLEISRITSGKIDLNRQPLALAELVRSTIETSQPLIDQGRHALTVELPDEPVLLDGDRMRLTQVLVNLLNNAAKYTDPRGRIRLAARCDGDHVAISVQDNGIGILESELPYVFEMFTQGQRARSRGYGGMGIGLAMARRLVAMHGGTMEVHSEGMGRGSEFIVRLPLLRTEAQAPAASPRAGANASLSGQRILVVDDNRDAADSLAMLLEAEGAEVHAVYDGRLAMTALEATRAHVVLLDLGMPVMDGYEVARRLRADARFRNVRIVALTGWGQDSDRERTRLCGFDHHLTKPVAWASLEALLNAG